MPADNRNVIEPDDPSYYDLPMLKPPVWTPEVTIYFFLGGISVGSFVLARVAERVGGSAFRDLTRTATVVSAVALAPCAPLLIVDLGDPKRFHHMLRVFKPASPMNLGTWTLIAFTLMVGIAGLREGVKHYSGTFQEGEAKGFLKLLQRADGTMALVIDVAGIPLGLLLATYTGVLLTGTAVPMWSRNLYLPALFIASAMNTGTAAVNLALAAKSPSDDEAAEPDAIPHALDQIATTAHVAEGTALAAYLQSTGEFAEPITKGPLAPYLWGGVVAAGLILPEVLTHIPAPPKAKRWLRIAASVATLVGGAMLRYAIMQGGHHSANDPKAARKATRKG